MGSPFPGMDPYLLLGAARPAAHPQRSSLVPEKGKGRGEPGIPMSPSIIVASAESVSRSSVAHGLVDSDPPGSAWVLIAKTASSRLKIDQCVRENGADVVIVRARLSL